MGRVNQWHKQLASLLPVVLSARQALIVMTTADHDKQERLGIQKSRTRVNWGMSVHALLLVAFVSQRLNPSL